MTTACNNLTFDAYSDRGYAGNVGLAVRNLLAALLAVKPAKAANAAIEKPTASQRSKLKDIEALFAMADSYQHISPNLSAELRYMAARG